MSQTVVLLCVCVGAATCAIIHFDDTTSKKVVAKLFHTFGKSPRDIDYNEVDIEDVIVQKRQVINGNGCPDKKAWLINRCVPCEV